MVRNLGQSLMRLGAGSPCSIASRTMLIVSTVASLSFYTVMKRIHRLSEDSTRVGTVCGTLLVHHSSPGSPSYRRLQTHWGPELISKLVASQPQLADPELLAVFKRKWEYMCVYAEIGFAREYTSCHHFTFARPARRCFLVVRSTLT